MSELKEIKVMMKLGSVGDFATQDMMPEEAAAFWENHKKYCDQLKAEGRLGKEEECTIVYQPCALFDDPAAGKEITFSSRVVILDLSDTSKVDLKL